MAFAVKPIPRILDENATKSLGVAAKAEHLYNGELTMRPHTHLYDGVRSLEFASALGAVTVTAATTKIKDVTGHSFELLGKSGHPLAAKLEAGAVMVWQLLGDCRFSVVPPTPPMGSPSLPALEGPIRYVVTNLLWFSVAMGLLW